jgi:hypothetical protein
MADLEALIKELNKHIEREAESLKLWEAHEKVTLTDARGKVFDVRSEMMTRCKLNTQKYREMIAAAEKQAGK